MKDTLIIMQLIKIERKLVQMKKGIKAENNML